MFCSDAQLSLLINQMLVDQPDVWLINWQSGCPTPRAGCTTGWASGCALSQAQEKSVYCPRWSRFIFLTHQAEREGQTKYVVALLGSGPVV